VFQSYPVDNLYHFGIDTASYNLQELFGDVEVVCVMGSADRARAFAEKVAAELYPAVKEVRAIGKTERTSLFKVGKVMSLAHGMGNPSASIFWHEVSKLLWHAKVDFAKLKVIRMGTSGGVGVPAGSVVLTTEACDGTLELGYEHVALGRKTRYPAKADESLNDEILAAWKDSGDFKITRGLTMVTDDYYEGQGRRDGAFATWYDDSEKLDFLNRAQAMGVANIEMEATGFLYFFQKLGVRATVIDGALLDRLEGDQHDVPPATVKVWAERPQDVIMKYLTSVL
jgi:uridine phosphorylase